MTNRSTTTKPLLIDDVTNIAIFKTIDTVHRKEKLSSMSQLSVW
jgi:hypothetical protein